MFASIVNAIEIFRESALIFICTAKVRQVSSVLRPWFVTERLIS